MRGAASVGLLVLLMGSALMAQGDGSKKQSPYAPPIGRGIEGGNFVARNDFLNIRVGPPGSNLWEFQFAPGQWGDAVFSEHFPVWTPQWGGVSSFDMEVIQPFQELQPDRLAESKLRYQRTDLNQELQILRRVQFEPGAVRQFRITYILTNTGSATITDLRFFQIIDFDIVDSGGDYAWYNPNSDTVFMNDDRYFRIGFFGSRRSTRHSTGHWSFVLDDDWTDGELNNQDRHPPTGTTDAGVGLQWNIGDFQPGQSWELTVTFVFGGAAGIQALIPDRAVGRGRQVILDASASNSVDQIISYEWDLDNDGAFDDATGVQVPWVFNQLGQFLIHVQVRDSAGRVDTDSATITVIPDVDLTIASVAIEPAQDLKDGTPTTLRAIVRNGGTEATPGGFYVRFLAGGRFVGERFVSGLAANGQTEVAVPWRSRGGVDRLEAVADVYNHVRETDETDNRNLLNITAIPPADLTVTEVSISPSENLVDGQEVQVTAKVTNQGADTLNDFIVRLFVDNGFFGERAVTGGLQSGQSQTITLPFNVRARQQTVRVVADAGDAVGESDEANNTRDLTLPEIPLPDLTVSDLAIVPAENISYGQRVTLRAMVRNNGATTLVPFRVEFRVAGETLTQSVAGLQGGQSTVVEVAWVAKAGRHNLQVAADTTRIIPESNEDNNAAELTLPEITAPDLLITQITLNPASGFVSGDTATVVATVQISGSGKLVSPIPIALLDNGQQVSIRQLDAGLTAGQSVTLAFSWRVLPGTHTLRVVADPDNVLPEPDETNNATEQTVPEVPAPDLALSVALVPDNPFTGQPFSVRGQVRNQGAATRLSFQVTVNILDANDRVIGSKSSSFPNGLPANGTADVNLDFIRLFEMRTVKVKVALEGNIPDADATNDEATFTLPDVPPPDYAVTGIDAQLPPTVGYGQVVTFHIHLTNRGGNYRLPIGYPMGIPVTVHVSDQFVGDAFIGGLDSGVSTTVTFNWVIDRPVNNPTVRAVVDPNRQIPDADRTNNEGQTTLNLVVEQTDFAPESVRIVTENVPAGQRARVEATIRKVAGADYAGRLPVEVFVDGVSLGLQVPTVRLTDGEPTATVAFNWTVTPGQNRRVRVVIDPRNEIPESDEGNNALETTVEYGVDAPDFVVASVNFEPRTGVQQGSPVHFTIAIRNAGAGAWAGDVPVRVSFNTGFVRNFTLSNFASNETKEFAFEWTAVPGGNHLLTVEIDPEGRVAESDETNNALNQALDLVVTPRPILRLTLSQPPNVVGPTDRIVLEWELTNSGASEGTAAMSLSGLPDGWAIITPVSGIVPPNGALTGQVVINVPTNFAQAQTFTMTLQAQVGTMTATAQQNLRVETQPVISDLSPGNNQRLGSTTVTFTWRTQIPSSSEVFLKRPIDPDYQRFEGEPGTFHRVVVSGLRRNSSYQFFVRSVSAGGEGRSEERRIFITSGVTFSQPEYVAEMRRDYDQRLTVSVINSDTRPHNVKVELVDNPYTDAPAGLIGLGTFDEPALLNPGERLDVVFAAHFQDAQQSDYTFRIRVRTVGEPELLTDEAVVRMRVRQPRANLRVEQIAEDPLTQVKTFRVTNVGDEPATDVTIRPSDVASGQVGMQPLIEHAYLAPGQSIEFKVFPVLLPPGFRPFSPSDVKGARLTFENRLGGIAYGTVVPFDLYLRLNGVEVASLQNMVPDGVFSFPVPPQVLFPTDVSRSASPRMLPEQVIEVPPAQAMEILNRLRSGTHLQVSYANKTMQVPLSFAPPPSRQAGGQRIFIVEKGERQVTQVVNATHCANAPFVRVRFTNGFWQVTLDILKSNFNDGHFFNVSNFKLDLCTGSFKVAVQANDENEARNVAERLCETLTDRPPKPTGVTVTLHGDGPPFKRGKPVTVRAVVTGDGELSISTVVATFSNGDVPILLRAVSPNTFEGTWRPTNIPPGAQTDAQGNLVFPVTVTVTASGCEQTATGSTETQVKIGGIQITISKPQPEQGFRVDWTPGSETNVMISGKVTDDEGNGIPASMTVEYWFTKLGEDMPTIRSEGKDTSPQGAFAFIFATNFPGKLLVKVFATAKADERLKAFKRVEGIIRAKLQLQVSKDDYKFLRANLDGQKLREQPINITAEDVKEIAVQVFGLQLTEDNPPRLAWKPLKGAKVQIVNGGSKTTDGNGKVTFPISDTGQTVQISVDMVPELEVKMARFPKMIFARPDAEGKILVFLGKKVNLRTNPQTGLPEPSPDSELVVTGRHFKITVREGDGTTEGEIARPVDGDFSPFAHVITYRPPQALPEGNRLKHVKVFAEDITEGSEEPLYKGELVFEVFKDAGLTFSKVTANGEPVFKEPEPVPVDLVEGGGGVKVLPGIIKGQVQLFEEPLAGRPINGVKVSLTTPDRTYETTTDTQTGPEAGRFRLEIDPQRPEWTLPNPVLMPFVDVVAELHTKVLALQQQFGYNIPRFREQDGFENFKYRWDLRYETDKEKLQRILDAVKRLDAAVQVIPEAHPQMKTYMKEFVGSVAEIVLFALEKLKVFDKIAESMKIGKGIGKSSYLRNFLETRLASKLPPNILRETLDEIEAATIRHGGLTDQAIVEIANRVGALTGDNNLVREVGDELTRYRDELVEALSFILTSLKGDVVGWVKSALKMLGVKTEFGDVIDKIVDVVLNKVFESLLSGQDVITSVFNSLDWLTDQIAEGLLSTPIPIQPPPVHGAIPSGIGYRFRTQRTIDNGITQLGRYNFSGDTMALVREINEHKRAIKDINTIYTRATGLSITAAANWLTGLVKSNNEVLTGQRDFWKGAVEFIAQIGDAFIPISPKAVITALLAPYAMASTEGLQDAAWKDALGETHLPIAGVEAFLRFVTGSGRFTPVPSRSRQLDEYAAVVNQVKTALQNGDYGQVLQLAGPLAQASLAVTEAIRAKEAVVLTAMPIADERDQNFPARARQASDVAEFAFNHREQFLLWVNSFLAAETEDARDKALAAADRALQRTQEAMGLLDGALQQLQSLGVTVPALLSVTHREERTGETSWRITFTVTNIGGESSPAVTVNLVTTGGITLSQTQWSVPSLAPNLSQSLTVTAQAPQRFATGFAFVRTSLEQFTVNFVPAIVLLTTNDSVPPVIADLSPAPDATVRTRNPLISASVFDNFSGIDLSSLRMTLDGQQVNATYDLPTRRLSFQAQDLADGQHTVVVEGKDLDGNTARQEWRFTVDLTAPVEVTDLQLSPNPFSPNGDNLDETLTIRFRINGDATLTVKVVDGEGNTVKTLANEQPFTQGEHTLTWDGTKDSGQPAPEGTYSVQITATPRSRQGALAQGNIQLTRNPLSITDISVTPETIRLTKQTVAISFNLSQQATVRVKVYAGESTDDDGFVVRTLTVTDAPRGRNTITWDGRDDSGRFVTPGTYAIAIEAEGVTLASRLSLAGRVQVQSLPDLLPVTIVTEEQNGQTKLTAMVRNNGGEVAQNVVVRFFHQGNPIGDATIAEIPVGGEATGEILWDPHRGLLTRDVEVAADPDEQIDELEEFNNRLQMSVEVAPMRIAHTLPEGVSLVSVPIQLLDPTPQNAFGFSSPEETKVAWWDPQKEGDVKYRFANEIAAVEPGKGYFVKLPAERLMQWAGVPVRAQSGEPFVLNLQQGWNLIGLPRLGSIALSEVKVKRPDADASSAIAFTQPGNPLVEPYAWTYSNSERRYQLVYPDLGELGTFDAFRGYWVYAKEPCQALIPAQSRAVYIARKRSQQEGWFFRIEAQAGDARDVIVIGAGSNRMNAQKPPAAPEGQKVRLVLIDEQGRQWGASVAEKQNRIRWTVLLQTDGDVEQVALRFPDVGYLPKGWSAYLIDPETGKRRYLRTTPQYLVPLQPTRGLQVKTFHLLVEQGGDGLLRIVNVKVETIRGREVVIRFGLTRSAQTQVEVLTLTGRCVAILESAQERPTGVHRLLWHRNGQNGQAVPNGIYLLRITASDDEGRQTQATTTFRLR